ncbi:MAG TPA: hypothetical protein VFB21_02240 [Chthonomonadaceae bacterium]|nr:hypothetical protein [Chthonomonadaceae bacterium]
MPPLAVTFAGRAVRILSRALAFGSLLALTVGTGAQGWLSYGADPQHTALSAVPAQTLHAIRWSAPVDLNPQLRNGSLLIHYGTPLITPGNTVIIPVKTGANGGFRVEARQARDGALKWALTSDYRLPPRYNWTPSYGCTLTTSNLFYAPGAGGTVYFRTNPDNGSQQSAFPTPRPHSRVPTLNFSGIRPPRPYLTGQLAFYGIAAYRADQQAFDDNVFINTPLTADKAGNLYFGFIATAQAPLNLKSGIARLAPDGTGTWVAASAAAQDDTMRKVVHNCAPALSPDGKTLYIAVNDTSGIGEAHGYLLALDSQTLATVSKVRLKDVKSGNDADPLDDGTASPTVGPDGDVYYGVLERPWFTNNLRGWLLHFDSTLAQTKTPGAFGWDDTASIVPASAVPSYTGTSSYLLLTKYNNYAGGGDGVNKVAILDPNDSMTDPISGATVMKEILTIAGPTPDEENIDQFPNAVREWCINTAAIDPFNKCALVNNEDGVLYRWDFATNSFTERIVLTSGRFEAYTPTLIGPDGTVYAINDAMLFAVGWSPIARHR